MSDQAILELRGINKSFGPVDVLKGVDFVARAGEVTALVGDNGAGKSTLVKCVSGTYSIDHGEYLFDGKPVTVHSPRDASALGIEIVYQDLALCDNLDIVQNMFLGRERVSREQYVVPCRCWSASFSSLCPRCIALTPNPRRSPRSGASCRARACSFPSRRRLGTRWPSVPGQRSHVSHRFRGFPRPAPP